MENEKQDDMIVPEWLFKEPKKNLKVSNPKPIKETVRKNINLADKQLEKELAKKTLNPYYFTDRDWRIESNINLDTHHINHANSKLTIEHIFHNLRLNSRILIKS